VRTYYDEYQAALHAKEWTWDDMPFYRGKGARQSIAPLHDLDYLDVYERVYGRRVGCNGIGLLREVALTRITEAHGLGLIPDVDLCRHQQEEYARVLKGEGVTVHWIEQGDTATSAGAPLEATWAPQELLVVNGGAIVPKPGRMAPPSGRAEFLAHWAFWHLNIPTLRTIAGTGVAEVGATAWLAQDVYVVGLSPAYNQEGLDQLLETVRLTAAVDDLKVLTIRCQGALYFDPQTGASAHVTDLIAPLDVDKVLLYPAGIDTENLLWLERNGYQMIEADMEEHVESHVCNLKILEPGKVVMAAEAERTIEKVRDAGVEVIEVPYSAFHDAGAGFHRTTMEIHREPGPSLADR
jgi:N-dimethylarginine dimethylaminohydrolase